MSGLYQKSDSNSLAKMKHYTEDSCRYEESYVMEELRKWSGITLLSVLGLEPHMAWQVGAVLAICVFHAFTPALLTRSVKFVSF